MTSAFRCRWALEETGLSHEVVHLSLARADHKSPEYLKIHPLGSVPALRRRRSGRARIGGDLHVRRREGSRAAPRPRGGIDLSRSLLSVDPLQHDEPRQRRARPLPAAHSRDRPSCAAARRPTTSGPRCAATSPCSTTASLPAGCSGSSSPRPTSSSAACSNGPTICGLLRGADAAARYLARLRERPRSSAPPTDDCAAPPTNPRSSSARRHDRRLRRVPQVCLDPRRQLDPGVPTAVVHRILRRGKLGSANAPNGDGHRRLLAALFGVEHRRPAHGAEPEPEPGPWSPARTYSVAAPRDLVGAAKAASAAKTLPVRLTRARQWQMPVPSGSP